MNAISFFSGAGGLDLGIQSAGFNIRLSVELERNYCDTLRLNNHNNVVNDSIMNFNRDRINDILGEENGVNLVDNIDLMIGGSPCQTFSTAGKRQAFDDPEGRGQAMLKYIELIEEIQPKAFLLENVKGLKSAAIKHVSIEELARRKKEQTKAIENGAKKEDLPPLLSPDEEKGSVLKFVLSRFQNYTISYETLNSADYGIPQKRERMIFVGIRKDLNFKFKFPEPTHNKNRENDLKPWVPVKTVFDNLSKLNIKHTYSEYTPKRLKYMKLIPKGGGNWRDLPEELIPEAMGGAYSSGGGRSGYFRRIDINEPSPTVLTSPNQNSTNIGHPIEDRPLSIEEYKAIQGFPVDYYLHGSLSQQYVQIGNAVPIKLAEIIGTAIFNQLDVSKQND